MSKHRFDKLSPGQQECLRLYHQRYQIKQIASHLSLGVSTINQRLERARRILGASNSREAARLFDEHESGRLMWIPPTGSGNLLGSDELTPSKSLPQPDTDIGVDAAKATSRWPIRTREDKSDDMTWQMKFAWVVPMTLLALVGLTIVGLLSIALQDIFARAI